MGKKELKLARQHLRSVVKKRKEVLSLAYANPRLAREALEHINIESEEAEAEMNLARTKGT